MNPYIQRVVVLELDLNYNLLAIYPITTFINSGCSLFNLLRIRSSYYACAYYSTTFQFRIYKLDDGFNTIDSATFNNMYVRDAAAFNDELLLTIENYGGTCTNVANNAKVITLDTAFVLQSCFMATNLDTIITLPNGFINPIALGPFMASAKAISSTKILLTGNTTLGYQLTSPAFSYGMATSVLDQNMNVKNTFVHTHSLTNHSYMASSNYSAVKGNSIITVGVRNHNWQSFLQTQKTSLIVSKFDTSGNLVWIREHGGDMYYAPNGVIFTPDNGILISGMRHDSANAYYTGFKESFLLKLDENGEAPLPLGLPQFQKRTLHLYPNPASGKIRLETGRGSTIMVYDARGRMILLEHADDEEMSLDISDLPQGLYMVRLQGNGVIRETKLIKE